MTKIPSGHSLMESIAQKADATTLCQKHSQLYLNASSNPKGWAFQSNFKVWEVVTQKYLNRSLDSN